MKVEEKECHPRKLPLTIDYIAPYWYQAIRNVFEYQKRRDLAEVHKLVDTSRIKKGHELYKKGHIIDNTITEAHGGDVNALVKSEDNTKKYRVTMKNFLQDKLPQYLHEREEYIANLFVNCTCDDHAIGRYRDNSSILCKHINAVIWFLIDRFNMPKIFVMPEEKIIGYKKSETVELVTKIKALPLVKFTRYLNVLLLKRFRGINPAIGISIHKIDNKTNQELEKPQWLTLINSEDVGVLLKGIAKGYKEMLKAEGAETETEIRKKIDELVERKPWWRR